MNRDMTPVYMLLFCAFAVIIVGAFLINNYFRSRDKSKNKSTANSSYQMTAKDIRGWTYSAYILAILIFLNAIITFARFMQDSRFSFTLPLAFFAAGFFLFMTALLLQKENRFAFLSLTLFTVTYFMLPFIERNPLLTGFYLAYPISLFIACAYFSKHGLFDKDKRTRQKPSEFMRHTLFGEMPLKDWAGSNADTEPWLSFANAQREIEAGNEAQAKIQLAQILKMPALEARHYLQAWQALRTLGVKAQEDVAKHVYGVILEFNLPNGLDILAVYEDYRVRYYPVHGAAYIIDDAEKRLTATIDKYLAQAETLLANHKFPSSTNPTPPPLSHARIYILTASGIYIAYAGNAHTSIIKTDAVVGRLYASSTEILSIVREMGLQASA
jgi:hypothetical protein